MVKALDSGYAEGHTGATITCALLTVLLCVGCVLGLWDDYGAWLIPRRSRYIAVWVHRTQARLLACCPKSPPHCALYCVVHLAYDFWLGCL